MSAETNENVRRASEIARHLEGTLIADLKSLKVCALTENKQPDHGSLNYTIFLVGLIGCETLGRYAYGADLDQPRNDGMPDVGAYIIRFIDNYFPSKDDYKSISRILSDYLRHILVHGFAPQKDGYPFDLHLVVSKEDQNIPPLAVASNGRLAIQLDAISFINRIVSAFNQFKKKLESDTDLAKQVVAAEEQCKKISPPKEIANQFIASYAKLQRKS